MQPPIALTDTLATAAARGRVPASDSAAYRTPDLIVRAQVATTEPVEHPLLKALPGWRWLFDVPRGLVVILHPSGLWVEIDDDYLHDEMTATECTSIALALTGGVALGLTGLHHVEVTDTGGRYTARLVKA